MYGDLLMLIIFFAGVISHPTSCTEDSQCSSGFYCEEGAHFCRECLRCVDLRRESLLPSDACVKSVIDCGACLKGQVAGTHGSMDSGGACAPPAPPGAVLPPLAWAAIAASVLLIIIILCVFARTRTFKIIDFASRTSVQSLRQAERAAGSPPPPPYNDFDVLPTDWRQPDAPEAERLMELPALSEKPLPNEEMRPREASASQAARVFNNPAYIRVPQNNSRYNTPEAPILIQQIANDDEASTEARSIEAAAAECNKKTSSLETKTRAESESQDTNNNFCEPEESPPNRPHRIVNAGATFVINVVENINNMQQRNNVTF